MAGEEGKQGNSYGLTYVADFETRCSETNRLYGVTSVWLWDICRLGSLEHTTGNTMEEFIDEIELMAPCTIYFHNLKFDGNFLISWLLKNGFKCKPMNRRKKKMDERTFDCLITELGVFYTISICFDGENVVQIRDSLKKIPGTVREMAAAYGLPISKGDCDYTMERPDDYQPTDDEVDYVRRDTEIVARVLQMQYDQGMTFITSASDTLNLYKDSLKGTFRLLFPVVTEEVDEYIRESYRGGVCQVADKYRGKEVTVDNVYDVNSMYPYQMCEKLLPYGNPVHFDGEYEPNPSYPLYIQRVRVCLELKEGMQPSILEKSVGTIFDDIEYIRSTDGDVVELTLTCMDLDLMFLHYHVMSIEYVDGYMFHGSRNLFKKYLKPLYDEKCSTKGARRQLMKILINSLYGKFASQTKRFSKVPKLDQWGVVHYEYGDERMQYVEPVYTAVACFITAYARAQLFEVIRNNQDIFMYCDTDSVHLNGVGRDIWVDSKALGAWKIESDADKVVKAKYLGPKCYFQILESGAHNVKIAGCPDAVKDLIQYDEFKEGSTFGGKLVPKLVNGGVILEDTYFTINPRR